MHDMQKPLATTVAYGSADHVTSHPASYMQYYEALPNNEAASGRAGDEIQVISMQWPNGINVSGPKDAPVDMHMKFQFLTPSLVEIISLTYFLKDLYLAGISVT